MVDDLTAPPPRDTKHHLEIRVIDRKDEGGVTEAEAADHNGTVADAFVLLRVTISADDLAIGYSAIEGWSNSPMTFESQINLWLAYAGYLARTQTTNPTDERQRKFVEHVLGLMGLTTQLGPLAGRSDVTPIAPRLGLPGASADAATPAPDASSD